MKILFCPAHYALLNDRGSELEWAYKITDFLGRESKNSVAVTGFSNVHSRHYRIIRLQPQKKSIDLGFVNTFRFAILYGKKALKLLNKENFDIHHHILPFYLGRTFNIAMLLSKKNKVKRVIGPIQRPLPFYLDNLHDQAEKLSLAKLINNTIFVVILRLLDKLLSTLSYMTLRKADLIIAIDRGTAKILQENNIDKSNIAVIPAGIDVKKFSHKGRVSVKKHNTIQVLSTGALIKRKGFDQLILGVHEVLKSNPHLRFHINILGDGPQKSRLEHQVRALGLSKVITFRGHISYAKMPAWYKSADVFLSMSNADSFGQMYLEAMASGLAIITSRNYGSESLIKNGKNGILIKRGDYRELSRKLALVLTDRKLRSSLQSNALNEVQKYDWESVIIPRYALLYNRLSHEK